MDLIQLYRLEAQPEVARASIATLIPFWCEHEGQLHLQDQLRNNHRNGFCCASIDVVTLSACQPPQLFDHPFNAALYQFPRMVLPIINASIHGSVLRRGSHVGGLVWTSIFDSSLADLVEPSAVTSSKVDRFVCICGLVTRVGPVRPQASSITYSCPQCFERILVYIDDGVWTAPKKCSRLQCNQKQFAPTRRTVTAKESQLLR
ncbi:MAG: uncharacterized protein KVP18_004673 [Porospora cf. gigantea A]|uniref:uncharacterized protein n=1 Tax=Porospora cf. gigantea A TaxID=2853593 RepID=UPI00355A1699|nr:MAG: hypothetical protein KVP18_004673 [Porospora cf. gigantea A]